MRSMYYPGRAAPISRHSTRWPQRRLHRVARLAVTVCALALLFAGSLAGAHHAYASVGPGATSFAPNEDWTHGTYLGSRGNYFADVDGDGKADAIVVNTYTVTVRLSTGSGFSGNQDWTHGTFVGDYGNYFADVTGDGKADAIIVGRSGVIVRRSQVACFVFCWGYNFGSNETWYPYIASGYYGLYFADVNGDSKVDMVEVGQSGISVFLSNGSSFSTTPQTWSTGGFHGTYGTYLFDVDADGKADVIAVNYDRVLVERSTGSSFGAPENWLNNSPILSGTHGIYFANTNKYGALQPLMLNVNDAGVLAWRAIPLPSNPNTRPLVYFQSYAENWTGYAYLGTYGNYFADVTGDGQADAIVVNADTVVVRRATP